MSGLGEGRQARDAGIEQAENARTAELDRQLIDRAILALARETTVFSANEVRKLCPNIRPAMMGARFLAAARAGVIERIGTVQADSASRHANRMGLWRSLQYQIENKINWPLIIAMSDFTEE